MQETQVEELLRENSAQIDALAAKLGDVMVSRDDVWLMRYILSNKTAEAAESPARFHLKWMAEHAEKLATVRATNTVPNGQTIAQFSVSSDHKFTIEGEPLVYVRIGVSNTKTLMDQVPYDDVLFYMVAQRIRVLDHCDALTRSTGKLVKVISVLDFHGFNLTTGNDSRFTKVLSESSKLSENLFPQLLGKTVFLNVPSFLYAVISLLKGLFSKRTVEKMVFCPGQVSGKPISACPFVSQFMKMEDVPTFVGGKCNCPHGCVGGVPSSQTSPMNDVLDGLASITVSARSSQSIELPFPAKSNLNYLVKVVGRKVGLHILFRRTLDSIETEIVPKTNLDEETGDVKGTFLTQDDGLFIMHFDNSHSFLRSKTVLYKVDLD